MRFDARSFISIILIRFDDTLTLNVYDVSMVRKIIPHADVFHSATKSQSFLLRLWQSQGLDNPEWNISLENPTTRELKVFHDEHTLFIYLTQIMNKKQAENFIASKEKK